MARIVWTKQAFNELDSFFDYIAEDSPSTALKWYEKFIDRVSILNENPQLGRVRHEQADENLRELILSKYKVIYEVVGAKNSPHV